MALGLYLFVIVRALEAAQLAKYCMVDLDPTFVQRVQPGDAEVGGAVLHVGRHVLRAQHHQRDAGAIRVEQVELHAPDAHAPPDRHRRHEGAHQREERRRDSAQPLRPRN